MCVPACRDEFSTAETHSVRPVSQRTRASCGS